MEEEKKAVPVAKVPTAEELSQLVIAELKKLGVVKCESEDLGKLFEALAKAQGEMLAAKKDNLNSFFSSSYADLSAIVKATRPALAKYGLSVVQRILPNGNGGLALYTRLCHASGQWMESKMGINPPKSDIQSIGSYITYIRRYNYSSIVGAVDEEDDDGEKAMEEPRRQGIAPSKASGSGITRAQLDVLSYELEGEEEILESVLKGFSISKLADLPAKSYTKCLNRVREIKRAKGE